VRIESRRIFLIAFQDRHLGLRVVSEIDEPLTTIIIED
jgi:hypothetical protein